ncbi:MAG TPA: zf-HC2 domain-containing protein [Acidimicrobiales bacterium]|nr:zf-HC2 domain-containing protein [Acidimicrobiales bacterium]
MRLKSVPLVCREAVELMSDYLDGALSRRDRRRLARHLAGCGDCSAYLEQLRAVVSASGRVGPEDLDPAALDALTEVYRRFRAEGRGGEST